MDYQERANLIRRGKEQKLLALLRTIKNSVTENRELDHDVQDVDEEVDEHLEKRLSHKHGLIYFLADRNHDYKLSRSELSRFLECFTSTTIKEKLLNFLMSPVFDKDGDGIDVEGTFLCSQDGLDVEATFSCPDLKGFPGASIASVYILSKSRKFREMFEAQSPENHDKL